MAEKLSTIRHSSGKILISGLFWQPLTSVIKKDAQAKVLEVADQLGFDLGVVGLGDHSFAGLCSRSDGGIDGAYSLALLVSDGLTKQGYNQDCLVATSLGDGRWLYFARNSGSILHDGDFVGNEDEVRTKMHQHFTMAEWPVIIAPGHWRFHDSIEKTLDDILPRDKKGKFVFDKQFSIKPLRLSFPDFIKTNKKSLIALGAILAVSLLGNNYYKVYKEKIAAEIAAKRAAEAAFAKRISLPPPWHAEAEPVAMAESCMGALDKIPLVPGGWNLTSASCTSSGMVSIEWNRPDYGSISMLRSQIQGADISADGNKAMLTQEVKPGLPIKEFATTKSEGFAHIFDRMQSMGITVQLTPLPEPPVKEGDPPIVWQANQWAATTQLRPDDLAKVLKFPGLRISSITLTFDGNSVSNYKLEGVIYAKK